MIGVLIPVHNEEQLLGLCLQTVLEAGRHPALTGEPVVILVVLDSCSDGSAEIARQYNVDTLEVSARNVGQARAAGASALLARGARWIACTDGDSSVAEDWLVEQLALDADAVCGTVTPGLWNDDIPLEAQSVTSRATNTATVTATSTAPTWASALRLTPWQAVSHRWLATKTSI